ncbi:hypothetical protein TWF718_007803 [Orbilia javanica]|uniref:NWD NACHT-NTPase N-terminal domain-containing protein n=1 Tax=Orbilia javanica TaxID=47235 RepID=A0AAN8RBX5_9PEZI
MDSKPQKRKLKAFRFKLPFRSSNHNAANALGGQQPPLQSPDSRSIIPNLIFHPVSSGGLAIAGFNIGKGSQKTTTNSAGSSPQISHTCLPAVTTPPAPVVPAPPSPSLSPLSRSLPQPHTGALSATSAAANLASPDLWKAASDKLKESEREYINNGNLSNKPWSSIADDLDAQIKSLRDDSQNTAWELKWRGRTVKLRGIAERVAELLQKFKEVGDVAVQYDPVHAALPWAGVRYLLQVVVSEFECQEAILIGVETVGKMLVRFTAYEKMYLGVGLPHEDALKNSLVELYFLILRFLIKSKRRFEESKLSLVGKAFVPQDYLKKLDRIRLAEEESMKDIRTAADQLNETHLASIDTSIQENYKKLEIIVNYVKDTNNQISQVDRKLDKIIDNLKEKERGEALAWVSPINHELDHEGIFSSIMEGTCSWLHNEPKFIEWRNSAPSSIFWLRGDPGFGKTRITSSVIGLLLRERELKPNDCTCIAYFYCDGKEGGKLKTDPTHIICSLLKQMARLATDKPLQPALAEVYKKRLLSGNKSSSPSLTEASQIISRIGDDNLYSTITIIIDGLDEAEQSSRRYLIKALIDLVQKSKTRVKIFLSSRPHEDDLNIQLRDVTRHSIDLLDTSADVELFIDEMMSDYVKERWFLPHLSDDKRTVLAIEVTRELKKLCRGMFLWAELQMKEICKLAGESQIKECLKNLPIGLEKTYERIFDKIRNDGLKYTQQIVDTAFKWVLGAARSLRPGELVGAIRETTKTMDLNLDYILEKCGNLLVLDDTKDEIRFIHFSAIEYVRRTEKVLPGCSFQEDECYNSVTLGCLTYLSDPRSRRFDPSVLYDFWAQNYLFFYFVEEVFKKDAPQIKKDFKQDPSKLGATKEPGLEFTTFVYDQWLLQLRKSLDHSDKVFMALRGFLGTDAGETGASSLSQKTSIHPSCICAFQSVAEYLTCVMQESKRHHGDEYTKILQELHEKWDHTSTPDVMWQFLAVSRAAQDRAHIWGELQQHPAVKFWNGFDDRNISFFTPKPSPFLFACCIGAERYIKWAHERSGSIAKGCLSLSTIRFRNATHRNIPHTSQLFRESFNAIVNLPNFTTTESEIVDYLVLLFGNVDLETWFPCAELVIERHTQFGVDPFCVARFALYVSCRSRFGYGAPRNIVSTLSDTSKYPAEILMQRDVKLQLNSQNLWSWLVYGFVETGGGVLHYKDCGGFQKYLPEAPCYILDLSEAQPWDFVSIMQSWIEEGVYINITGKWGSLCHVLLFCFIPQWPEELSRHISEEFDKTFVLLLDSNNINIKQLPDPQDKSKTHFDINIRHPCTGETPLEYALRLADEDNAVVVGLLRHGSKITKRAAFMIAMTWNREDKKLLEGAMASKISRIARRLSDNFIKALRKGHSRKLIKMVKNGYDLQAIFKGYPDFAQWVQDIIGTPSGRLAMTPHPQAELPNLGQYKITEDFLEKLWGTRANLARQPTPEDRERVRSELLDTCLGRRSFEEEVERTRERAYQEWLGTEGTAEVPLG